MSFSGMKSLCDLSLSVTGAATPAQNSPGSDKTCTVKRNKMMSIHWSKGMVSVRIAANKAVLFVVDKMKKLDTYT